MAKTKQHAFTLIELVIVLGIVSLMLGAAIPMFSSVLSKERADSVAEEVAMTLRLANQKSIFQQAKHDFVIDFRKNHYWLEFLQPGKHSKKLKYRPDQIRSLGGDFEFLMVYFPEKDDTEKRRNARIAFNPDGTSIDTLVFLGIPTAKGSSEYRSLMILEIRGSDGRVRILPEEERREYEYLL